MKKQQIIVSVIALFSVFQISAFASDPDITQPGLGISSSYYYGVRADNGFQLGVERYALRMGKYDVLQNASALLQTRSGAYTSLMITVGSTIRRNLIWGIYFDHSIRVGYSGHYYDFDIYESNSNAEVVNKGQTLKSSLIVGYSFALGYDLGHITNQNIHVFARPNIFLKLPNPDNLFLLNNFGFEAGFSYFFK